MAVAPQCINFAKFKIPVNPYRAIIIGLPKKVYRANIEAICSDTKPLTQIVAQHSALALAVELADEFLRLLRQQRAEDFDDWLMKALKSSLKPFVQFAEGLFEDLRCGTRQYDDNREQWSS